MSGDASDHVAPAAHRTFAGRIGALIRRPDIGGMAVVVGVKIGMVLLNFTLITLAARLLDPEAFGHYSILYSAAGLLCIVAAAGQEPFVLRMWNEMTAAGNAAKLKGALYFTLLLSLSGTVIVAIGLYFWASALVDGQTAITCVIYMMIVSVLQICMHLVRTEIGVASGDGAGNAIVGSVPVLYLLACFFSGTRPDTAHLFLALAVGAGLALLLQLYLIRGRILHRFPDFQRIRAVADYRLWLPRSVRFWLATSLEATNQYIDVIIIGYLMDPVIAGAYFVTVRLANLFAAAADSVNLFGTRHLPGLYYRGEQRALNKMLDSLAWITLAFSAIGLIGILVGGYFALLLINEPYAAYFPELLVLCLGTAALGTTRPSVIMLLLAGHEGRYLQIMAVCVVVRIAGFFLFVPHFGVMGAVATTAAAFALQSIVLRTADKALTGFDSSMFRLLLRRA